MTGQRPTPTRAVRPRAVALGAMVFVALSACAPPEEILPGERFGLRETQTAAAEFEAQAEDGTVSLQAGPQPATSVPIRGYSIAGEAQAIRLPGQRANAEWTHVSGAPSHRIVHPALGTDLTRVWSAEIGAAGTRRVRATADPVVADGRVFTMSAFSEVQATSTGGAALWRRDLTPASESAGEASGGGLAHAGGRLYVTTGYGELHVLDAGDGRTIWRQDLDAVPSAAPTVAGGIVYLTTRDSRGWAIDAGTGRVIWQIEATDGGPVITDGAAPAVSDRVVVLPFGSGDLIAALREGGLRLWTATLAGERTGVTYARVGDLTADPVIDGDRVYAGTPTGRLAAIDLTTGARLWTAQEGALSAVWPSGGSVFLVSDLGEIVRLDAADGSTVWSATLPYYTEERVSRRKGVFAHYGPVLAGGRLIVASTDGRVRQVDPASGQLLAETAIDAPAAANPVVAGRTLYVVTQDGMLHAFR